MAKSQTPIVKRSRRLGITLGKEKYVRRRSYPPGIHGPKQEKGRKRMSSYGEQLREKQKARAIYGMLEKQFRRFFKQASNQKGNTAEILSSLLERRLDNTVFRLGLALTRPQARQMVNHGFFTVNQKRLTIPSYVVRVGDVIELKPSKKEKGIVKQNQEALKQATLPSWLSRDLTEVSGKVTSLPAPDDLENIFDSTLIV